MHNRQSDSLVLIEQCTVSFNLCKEASPIYILAVMQLWVEKKQQMRVVNIVIKKVNLI